MVYTSADTVIASATAYTFNHGLGAEPNFVALKLICQTAEGNYAVGDHVMFNPAGISYNNSTVTIQGGWSTRVTGTQILIRTGFSLALTDATAGTMFSGTFANWKLRVIAQ